MKNLLLFSSLFFISFLLEAANWHPFPFKAAFYSRNVQIGEYNFYPNPINSNGPLQKGLVIEGLYLDSTFQKTNGLKMRSRSSKFPLGVNWPGFDLAPSIYETNIQTSADSSKVVYFHKDPFSDQFDSIVFLPHLKQVFTTNQFQKQFAIEDIFGFQDSVVYININELKYKWSKRFGIIQFESYSRQLNLIGIQDLNIGWKPFTGKPALPKVGDEYHYQTVKRYDKFYGYAGCGVEHIDIRKDFRVKVLAYPYQNDSSLAHYEYIESVAGSNTGIRYGGSGSIHIDFSWLDNEAFKEYKMPGTFNNSNIPSNQSSNGFFIDSLGITMAYRTSPFVWDGSPVVEFIPCTSYPIGSITGSQNFGVGPFCNFQGMDLTYPYYIKSQHGCTMGTPLPLVTITSVSSSKTKPSIKLSPNPAQNFVKIQLEENPGLALDYELSNVKGQTFKGSVTIQNGEAALDLSKQPAGLYILRLFSGGSVWTEKIVLEK